MPMSLKPCDISQTVELTLFTWNILQSVLMTVILATFYKQWPFDNSQIMPMAFSPCDISQTMTMAFSPCKYFTNIATINEQWQWHSIIEIFHKQCQRNFDLQTFYRQWQMKWQQVFAIFSNNLWWKVFLKFCKHF